MSDLMQCGHPVSAVRGRTTQHCGACADEADRRRIEGWTNWNPNPLVHAYGTSRWRNSSSNQHLALCRVIVRQCVGTFDPADPDACPACAGFVAAGLTWDDVKNRKVPLDGNTIVCRRSD